MNQTHKPYTIVIVFVIIAISIGCTEQPSIDKTTEENKAFARTLFG